MTLKTTIYALLFGITITLIACTPDESPAEMMEITCSNGSKTEQACDDGDASTVNDVETVLNADGSICVPCAGTPVDCTTGATSVQSCDDGDPTTINDMETVLDADGTVCVPCQGEVNPNAAPNFSLLTTSGDTLKLQDYQGKNLVIFFFGYACPFCQSVGPSIESDLYEAYRDNDKFAIIGADQWDGNNAGVDAFAESAGVTFPLGVMASSMASEYESTYDRLVVVDSIGSVIFRGSNRAASHLEEVVGIVDDLLK